MAFKANKKIYKKRNKISFFHFLRHQKIQKNQKKKWESYKKGGKKPTYEKKQVNIKKSIIKRNKSEKNKKRSRERIGDTRIRIVNWVLLIIIPLSVQFFEWIKH